MICVKALYKNSIQYITHYAISAAAASANLETVDLSKLRLSDVSAESGAFTDPNWSPEELDGAGPAAPADARAGGNHHHPMMGGFCCATFPLSRGLLRTIKRL